MHNDAMNYCRSCPECMTVAGSGILSKSPLYPTPIQRHFPDTESECYGPTYYRERK